MLPPRQESDGRSQDPLAEMILLVSILLVLKVFEAGPAKMTSQDGKMKVHVFKPGWIQLLQHECAKCAAFGAAQAP